VVSDPDPGLDQLPTDRVVELLLDAETRVLHTLRRALPELSKAATALSAAITAGARLVFVGAGTSGRLAAAEAAELPGTFGIEPQHCPAVIAGAAGPAIDDTAEDDADAGTTGIRALELGQLDVVVAVAASGSTPFTLAAATEARAAGARVIAVVNATGSPLARLADPAVELDVGDEVLHGSTRLNAGTAQKIALNTLTTAAMAQAGRVHGNLMIDVVPANAKLRARAAGIVSEIAGCPVADAEGALAACGDNAGAAVLHLVRGLEPADAVALAAAHPSLRRALDS
jgi:N-acetylmuramic acid 6-phosphate etherase